MNDGQTGEILDNSIDKIKENRLFIIELINKVKFLENKEKEFSKKISEIEENFKNEIEKLRDEFKNNVLNESSNTEKNNFNNSSEEMFPSKLEDKKAGEEGSNLNSENENPETKLIEENKKLEKEKNDKIDEIKKLKEDLAQEKNNFNNLKTKFSKFEEGAKDEFLKLKEEIKSRDVKINNLSIEKTDLEKKVGNLGEKIFSKNQTITRLENQVSSLTEDVKNRDNKISGLEKDKYELKNDKNDLISRLADFKDLEELEALYSEYLKIPENDREKYDAILKPHLGKDMFLYLVTTKFSNYKDFLKNDFIENANFYAVLVKIYDYVINVMNKEYDEEVYEFLNPEIGERYNPISQIPSSNSVSNGEVARVIVKGYQRRRDKKLLYQSIVLLK